MRRFLLRLESFRKTFAQLARIIFPSLRGLLDRGMPATLGLLVLIGGAMTQSEAGWPFTNDRTGPDRRSPEYYNYHACRPIGQRQTCHHGKLWPPRPRPTGEKSPWIHRFHHNHYWPYPYIGMDRDSVRQFAQLQIDNGWRDATTIYEYHFDEETQLLNSAGRDHLYWIMSNVPAEYRNISVQASRTDPGISNLRLINVQQELGRLVGIENTPMVSLRIATPYGTPAQDINAVFEARRQTLNPPPFIEYSAEQPGDSGG